MPKKSSKKSTLQSTKGYPMKPVPFLPMLDQSINIFKKRGRK
jgi:enoyl reductase-like protein